MLTITSPLWLPLGFVLALWIRTTSPGPVFFRQTRIGRAGRPFVLWKFRTLQGTDHEARHARHIEQLFAHDVPLLKLDATDEKAGRLIPLGRLIRAAGFDEIPQIFNILRGEMSLVGPRPVTPAELAACRQLGRSRLKVRPGLTGWWQVNGKNETTLRRMLALDAVYVRHTSHALDLSILIRTISVVLRATLETLAAPSSATIAVPDAA